MSRLKLTIILSGAFVIAICWFFIGGGGVSAGQKAAAERSIEFVVENYSLQEDEIDVEKVKYWEEEDRYAIQLKSIVGGEKYELALRLDEDLDVAFIIDVTGQFDEFGLAYCH
ncbi:MAG: hypothetical protein LRY73_04310 [Bacillus sp. (in: Bacteria)]|nr:hypothetical protein [Bacillus sp. (in: firmicutes)]